MAKDTSIDSPYSENPQTTFDRLYSDHFVIDRLSNTTTYDPQQYISRGGTWQIFIQNALSFKEMQKNSFGATTPFGKFDQLIRYEKGLMYFAAEKEKPGKMIGYVVLQTENLDESAIQDEMKKLKSGDNGDKVFHDHLDYPLPQDTVLVAELGILKEFQKKGYGLELLKSVMHAYQAEHGGKHWMAFVRINNIGPLKVDTRLNFGVKNNLLLGSMSMIGMQGPTKDPFGSKETNFRADSIVPAVKVLPPGCNSSTVWKEGDPKPSGNYFFLPMPPGEQADLENSKPMTDMLRTAMAYGRIPVEGEDFVMRKVCEDEELKRLGIANVTPGVPHLFFTKDWKYGVE